MITRIKYYIFVIRWIWQHRTEKDCRQKWKRMEREWEAMKKMKK